MIILRLKYFILLLPLLTIASCESDVKDMLLPEFDQKLVVTGFLSPGKNEMKFTVSLNERIYGELDIEEPFNLKTAYLSDGSKEVELTPVENGFRIRSEIMPLDYGKTYSLRISDGNELSVESVCTIPIRRDFYLRADTFTYKKPHQMEPGQYFNEIIRSIKVSFTDFPGEKNYYRVAGEFSTYHTMRPSGNIIKNKYSLTFEKELLTDHLLDGKVITLTAAANLYYNGDSSFMKLYLLNTEESYYLYHKSIGNHNYGENPFAEATPVYSNIKGGLGVFTSYTIDSVIIRVK